MLAKKYYRSNLLYESTTHLLFPSSPFFLREKTNLSLSYKIGSLKIKQNIFFEKMLLCDFYHLVNLSKKEYCIGSWIYFFW